MSAIGETSPLTGRPKDICSIAARKFSTLNFLSETNNAGTNERESQGSNESR